MIIKKEIKFGKRNGKNAAAARSILSNGHKGSWFAISIGQAKQEIKDGCGINGIEAVEV